MKQLTRHHFNYIVINILLVIISACQKNDSTTKTPFTNAAVKSIFDSKCASCHAASGFNPGAWLYDPTDYNTSIKNSIKKIYETVYLEKSMPQGTSLSASDLQVFKSWYDAGYPSN